MQNFLAPEIQTCGVFKDHRLIRLEERPVPLMMCYLDKFSTTPKSPYSGRTDGFYLNDGVELIRTKNGITEFHPDGTEYVWFNPDYVLRSTIQATTNPKAMFKFVQLFADGSMKAVRHSRATYHWSAPVVRPYVPFPCRPIIFEREEGVITGTSELMDYTNPHPVDCICLDCSASPIMPVYNHLEECTCYTCERQRDLYDTPCTSNIRGRGPCKCCGGFDRDD